MLAALGWRACAAEKVDFVHALLDVTLPADDEEEAPASRSLGSVSGGSGGRTRRRRRGTSPRRPLAHLQIQLSDFETTFTYTSAGRRWRWRRC